MDLISRFIFPFSSLKALSVEIFFTRAGMHSFVSSELTPKSMNQPCSHFPTTLLSTDTDAFFTLCSIAFIVIFPYSIRNSFENSFRSKRLMKILFQSLIISFLLISCASTSSKVLYTGNFPIDSGIHLSTWTKQHIASFDKNKGKIAVIVEPRASDKMPLLIPIVDIAIKNLPSDWKFQIFHGPLNEKELEAKYHHEILSGRMILTRMDKENLTVSLYNQLMLDRNFWDHVQGESVLIFETDSIICSEAFQKDPNAISKFEKYDYVGAPWDYAPYGGFIITENNGKTFVFAKELTDNYKFNANGHRVLAMFDTQVGNSGFSLRKRSKMMKMLSSNNYPANTVFVESKYDIFIAGLLRHYGFSVPSVEIAQTFSSESILPNEAPIGIHKPWLNMRVDQLVRLEGMCKNLGILKSYYSKSKWGN